MIRPATIADLPRILPMAKEFFIKAKEGGTFNSAFFSRWWSAVIESGQGGILISEDGDRVKGIFGFVINREYLTGDLVFDELFWYGDSMLFRAGVNLSKKLQCKRTYISCIEHLTAGELKQLYMRNGFAPRYARFVKEN